MIFKATKIFDDTEVFIGLLISSVLLLLVVSFTDYFFFIPDFSNGISIISIFQIFSNLGWVLLICVPPVLISRTEYWDAKTSRFFLVSIFMWPIATSLIKISTYFTYKVWIIDYLKEFPIFIFMDLVAPILYLLLWIRIKESELEYVPEVSKQKIK